MPEEIINGYRMHHEVYGQGQPLVMVHGGLGGGEGCAATVEHHADSLSKDFRLIFYDRRSAGRSETPSGGYGMENQVRDLSSLLERLGVAKAHVLGSSAGGPIATRFALDHPHMVDCLILVNTMSYASEPERQVRQRELESLLAHEAAHGKAVTVEKALEARQPTLRSSDPVRFKQLRQVNLEHFDGLAPTLRSYLEIGDSIETRLGELGMPTLIVHGEADSRIPVACSRRLHQGISGSELHIIPGAEHGLMTNEAGQMGALIVDFLQRSAVSLQLSGGARG
ncbi:MAG: hypothetical protein BZY88_02470 [SAR202 cluster bacterium Io17-Chloro-G9]|nr:MAG: hypothetical protein BZY88_02470 [SAR202 cluster bacterium Io17-Chloro-G9]